MKASLIRTSLLLIGSALIFQVQAQFYRTPVKIARADYEQACVDLQATLLLHNITIAGEIMNPKVLDLYAGPVMYSTGSFSTLPRQRWARVWFYAGG